MSELQNINNMPLNKDGNIIVTPVKKVTDCQSLNLIGVDHLTLARPLSDRQ